MLDSDTLEFRVRLRLESSQIPPLFGASVGVLSILQRTRDDTLMLGQMGLPRPRDVDVDGAFGIRAVCEERRAWVRRGAAGRLAAGGRCHPNQNRRRSHQARNVCGAEYFPAGRIGTPHFHNQDRYITVLKGTWWVSLGPESDSGDKNKMIPIKAGGYVFHPANGHHFDGAKTDEVTVQIIGMGQVITTRIEPTAGTAQR